MTLVSEPTITLNPSGNAPLAALVEFETAEAAKVSLIISDGSETRTVYFGEFATEHDVPVFGLKPDSTYTVDVSYTGEDGVTEVAASDLEVATGSLPDDFPIINTLVSNPDLMEPGFTSFRVGQGGYWVLVDEQGDVVWFAPLDGNQLRQLSADELNGAYDGQLLARNANGYNIYDLFGDIVAVNNPPLGDLGPLHHEMFVTEDDTFLTLGRIEIEVDGYPTSETDPTPRDEPTLIEEEPVIEFDLDGNILNVWNLSDIIDPTRVGYGSHTTFRNDVGLDWIHDNAVITDPKDDSIIVSLRHQDAVIKFDRNGDLIWILGTHENWKEEFQPYLLEPVGEPFEWQYHQHAMEFTADGNLLLFDNGNERASPYDGTERMPPAESYSRAVKYAIDEEAMEVSQVWEYVPDPTLYAPSVGDADEQPTTGNVLTDFGSVTYVGGVSSVDLGKGQEHVRIIEVTQEETPEVVFDLEVDLSDTSVRSANYRAERLASLYSSDTKVFQLLVGDEDDNTLIGNIADNELRGLGGDDNLDGGPGNDLLLGGDGDDTLKGGFGFDTMDGGDGTDTADLSHSSANPEIYLDLGQVVFGGGVETLISIENAIGTNGNNVMTGTEGANRLEGGVGNDTVMGSGGDDTLIGGDGDDQVMGGSGDDIIAGDGASASLRIHFLDEDAGYRSVYGWYDEQTLQAKILVANVDLDTNPGLADFEAELPVDPGKLDQIGFFIIPDGYSLNRGDGEPLAGGDPTALDLEVFEDGGEWKIKDIASGHVFEGRGNAAYFTDADRNADGEDHVVSDGDLGLGGVEQSWEDLPNLGDGDFNDLAFGVEWAIDEEAGGGNDTLQGDGGADWFVFRGVAFEKDVISDFALGMDKIVFERVGSATTPDSLTYEVGDFDNGEGVDDIRIAFNGLGASLADERIDVLNVGSDIEALKADLLFA